MILQRYLIKEVFTTTVVVLSFLTLMLLGSRVIQLFGKVAHGGLDVSFLLPLVLFKLASVLVLLLPLSFFIGLMLVVGRLYVDQEMTVVQSSGISAHKLVLTLWPLVLVLVLVQAFLSLYAADWGERKSKLMLTEQAIKGAFEAVKPKTFIRAGDYSLYVGAIDKQKRELLDILLIHKDGAKLPSGERRDVIIIAKRAAQAGVNTEQGIIEQGATQKQDARQNQGTKKEQGAETQKHMVKKTTMLDLHQGSRYELGANQLAHNHISFSKYRLSFSQTEEDEQQELAPQAQSTYSLWQKLTNPSRKHIAKAELGFRFSLPLVIVLAWMLAVPFAKVRPRQGRWIRLLPAILFFATSVVALISLKGRIASGDISVFANVLVILFYAGVAAFAYNQNKLKRRRNAKKAKRGLA